MTSKKRAQPGQKIRKIVGGADAVCTMAAMNALRAVRAGLVSAKGGSPMKQADLNRQVQAFDDLVLGTMFEHMNARCDMDVPSPKDHWAKMTRRYKEPWVPPVVGAVTTDPDEDMDAWLDEVDGTMPADPMDPFKVEGVKCVKEYARRGQQGQKHFLRKVDLIGRTWLVVGCSSGDDEDGDVAYANGAIGNDPFKQCSIEQVVWNKGEVFKVYYKASGRSYSVLFLCHKPGQKFRLWWSEKGSNKVQHYLVMEDSPQGFAKDPVRDTYRKAS